MSSIPDGGFENLVLAAQAGEGGAFDQLVERFHPLVFATALSAINDFQLAQDVSQEAFLEAHRGLGALQNPRAFTSWLRTITLRQALRAQQWLLMELREDIRDGLLDASPGPGAELELDEVRVQVLEALRRLPESQRLVLILFHLHGYELGEIARFLGLPLTTVKKRLSDGRNKLKERLITMLEETLESQSALREERRITEVVALVQAIERTEATEVARLLTVRPALAKTKLYDNDPRGQSLLQRAIPGDGAELTPDKLEVVRLLLEHGADANTPDWDGRPQPPLMRAAWGGHAPVIELLLQHGADPEAGPDAGVFWWPGNRYRPIDCAAVHGHTAAVEALIRGGARYTIADTIMAGLVDLTRNLLDENPERIREFQAGQTPLHHALSWHHHPEILELLLERGADVNAANIYGYTALPWALNRGRSEAVIEQLRQHGAKLDVFAASGLPELGELQRLLKDAPALANAALADGTTPLFFAVNAQSLEGTRLLLEAGAHPNVHGTEEWRGWAGQGTPLRLSARCDYRDIVALLLQHGAEVDGHTIINAANANLETLEMLLRQDRTAINFADPSLGFSAMDWMILHNNLEGARLLLNFGFNPNLVGPKEAQYSHAPLHFAAKYGRLEITELLLQHGADVKVLDRLLQTPAQVAAANGQVEVLRVLQRGWKQVGAGLRAGPLPSA